MEKRPVWPHRHLLDVDQLSCADVTRLLDLAGHFHAINARAVKKAPALKGRTVVLLFIEPSTRTRTSFDMAAKRLSADTFSLARGTSSMQKGESLKDTALTLQAMNPDVIVLRHSSSGAAAFLAQRLSCAIVNAGDGWHAHPTQALLDAFTLRRHWGSFEGRRLLILGDIAHSRVARSNVRLLTKMGAQVSLCGPRTLLPRGLEEWPVTVHTRLEEAVEGVDAVMCLRLQLERQQAGLLPDLAEYARTWCLTHAHLAQAAPNALVLHPGPMNRGLEIASDVADSAASVVLEQVNAGVAVRMAVLLLYANAGDPGDAL